MEEAKKYLEQELANVEARIEEARVLVQDPTMAEMAGKEIEELEKQKELLMKAIEGPDEVEDEIEEAETFKSVIIEIRPGVGGEEAKIWAGDLERMYVRFASIKSWKLEQLDEGVIKIKGNGVYEALKWETGVHRVQRVPETEAAGRIHTSTASVVVLPEVSESVIDIKEDDLLWEFTRGGGHGGQNVNKVATAVRLTHKPTGIIVQARQERFQEQNRRIALALLRAQLWEIEQEKKLSLLAGQRAAIGRSMRAEKIRTYNYPQNRVTDHRIGKSWHKLDKIVEGDLTDVTESLVLELGQSHTAGNNETTDNKSGSDGLVEP
jgi:peptide chain release factor 1